MTSNENTNDKHVKRSSETLGGIGTCDLSDSNHEVCDGSESSVDSEAIDVKIGGERESPGTARSDNNGCLIINTKTVKSVLIPNEVLSSSSLSELSSNDFFQSRKATFAGSPAFNFAMKDKESDVSHQSSIKSKPGNDFPVRVSSSPIYNLNCGHMNMFPTVAPSIQVMDRSSEYDPYRIPSSVFAVSKNTMDWTNDSDESLFSIQLGNPSLARDHLSTSPELGKSVELIESGELNMFSPQPSPLKEDKDTSRRCVETEDSQTTEMLDEDLKLEGSVDKNKSNLKNSYPAAVSYNSHVNVIGAQSAASPITSVHIPQNAVVHCREKKQEAPLCHCFTCSWPFCRLSWPSCSCRKCSLALRCCWHASPVLPEVENLNFVKKDNPHVTSHSTSNCCNLCQCFSWLCCTCSHAGSPRRQSYEKDSEKTSSSTSDCCNVCQCFSCRCCTCCSHADSTQRKSYEKDTEKTSSSTSNCGNVCQCFSWLCCTSCCSHTDSPRQQSSKKYSEKTSSSNSTCCNLCQCFSWLCCTCSRTDSPRQPSYEKDSKNTSNSASHCCSLCQCFSWLCCTSCCSHTDSPRQQSYKKASEKASSSTSHCCSWFHCFSASFYSWDNCCCCYCCCCCCSETDSTRRQSLNKTSEKTSSSSSNCIQCCSWSCCSLEENKFSYTDNPRPQQQSFVKTSEKTSCSISNCCSWSMCSWLGKSSCCSC